MSVTQMSQVWELDLTHPKQSLLLALADHAHDDGTGCYPGVPYLAWKTGYSERQAKRILADLERDEIIMAQDPEKKGGRGLATEYHLHLERGIKKSPYRPLKGGRLSEKDDKLAPFSTGKGAIGDAKGDIPGKKGDTAMSPQPGEPSGKPSVPAEQLLDDVTGRCLLLLRKVKGFPRDEGKVARVIAELRERFPQADAVKVCEEYQWKHGPGGMTTKNHPNRLRAFFEQGHKRAEQERGRITLLHGGRGRAVERTAHDYDEAAY